LPLIEAAAGRAVDTSAEAFTTTTASTRFTSPPEAGTAVKERAAASSHHVMNPYAHLPRRVRRGWWPRGPGPAGCLVPRAEAPRAAELGRRALDGVRGRPGRQGQGRPRDLPQIPAPGPHSAAGPGAAAVKRGCNPGGARTGRFGPW
jgi:hypothetical protein